MKRIDGMPVGNGAAPIRLTVTAADVRKGAPLNPNHCALAVAAVRQLPNVIAAKVHLGVLYLLHEGRGWRRWRTTSSARTEIIVFDRGGRFEPGVYFFDPVPTKSLVKRARRMAGTAGPRGPGRKRRKPHHVENVRDAARGNEGVQAP